MTSSADGDVEFTALCSAATLQSDTRGFFAQLAACADDAAPLGWLEDTFAGKKGDAEKVAAVLACEEIAEVVQEALCNVQPMFRGKSAKTSRDKRDEAQKAIDEGDLQKALLLCSQAIIKAPMAGQDEFIDGGLSLALALWVRSDCLMRLSKYDLALRDLKMALKERLPAKQRADYYWRMGNCYRGLAEISRARVSYDLVARLIAKNSALQEKLELDVKALESISEKNHDTTITPTEKNGYQIKKEVSVSVGANENMPTLSKLVKIADEPDKGRFAVAQSDIATGDILLVEEPYSACLLPRYLGSHCCHCFIRLEAPVWCFTCSAAAFCSPECRDAALATYHKYECQFVDLFLGSGMSILSHIALRMITQVGLEKTLAIYTKYVEPIPDQMVQDENENNSIFQNLENVDKILNKNKSKKAKLARGRKSTSGSKSFEKKKTNDAKSEEILKKEENCDKIASQIYKLCTHSERRDPADYFHRILMAMFLTKCLKKTDFFGKETADTPENWTREELIIIELILRNIQLLQFNAHELYETVRSPNHKFHSAKACYIAVAIYPTGALFNHECYPAVGRYFDGKKIILRALRPLKPNEVVAENYGPQFLVKSRPERQRALTSRYWFKCQCRTCEENWPTLKQMISGEIPLIKCPNQNCQSALKCTLVNKKKTWNSICFHCKSKVSEDDMSSKCDKFVKECISRYEEAAALMEGGNPEDACNVLCKAIDVFHEVAVAPHKETHIAQEALRSCFADTGNLITNTHIPSDYNSNIK